MKFSFSILSFIAFLSIFYSTKNQHFIVLPRMREYYTLESVNFFPVNVTEEALARDDQNNKSHTMEWVVPESSTFSHIQAQMQEYILSECS